MLDGNEFTEMLEQPYKAMSYHLLTADGKKFGEKLERGSTNQLLVVINSYLGHHLGE
jgi:hypothetical protein